MFFVDYFMLRLTPYDMSNEASAKACGKSISFKPFALYEWAKKKADLEHTTVSDVVCESLREYQARHPLPAEAPPLPEDSQLLAEARALGLDPHAVLLAAIDQHLATPAA